MSAKNATDDLPDTRSDAKFDRARARKAARHPQRPGEKCKAEPARYEPVVNHSRCEGKSDCVAVGPFDVFEVRRIADSDWKPLSPLAKLKVWAHKKQTAYAVRADACKACGLCVVACPEKAIQLVKVSR
jgi:NAD-dependent dihydropyrimidine dehydrogenase PreA subunit